VAEIESWRRTQPKLGLVISFGWGYATVSLHTKKIKGLHENDFIMAGPHPLRIFTANNSD
jgi:Pterin 4 alpha carbinolamine dehydratase